MKPKGIINNQLSVLRAKRRWTQQELAKQLGVSRQTIISLESNRYNPSLLLAFQIADLFGADINEVFQYESKEEE